MKGEREGEREREREREQKKRGSRPISKIHKGDPQRIHPTTLSSAPCVLARWLYLCTGRALLLTTTPCVRKKKKERKKERKKKKQKKPTSGVKVRTVACCTLAVGFSDRSLSKQPLPLRNELVTPAAVHTGPPPSPLPSHALPAYRTWLHAD